MEYFDIKQNIREIIFNESNFDKEYQLVENKDILFERYCVYDGQYDDARRVALDVLDMLKNGEKERKLSYTLIGDDKKHDVYLTIDDNKSVVGASCEVTDRGIEIGVCLSSIFSMLAKIDTDAVFTRIESSIGHELNHLYTYNKKVASTGKDEDAEWYDTIVEIFSKNETMDNVTSYFIRGLYFSYYHEVNAYASELPKQIEWIIINSIGKDKQPTKEQLINALKKSNVYMTYITIIGRYIPLLKSIDEDSKLKIVNLFKKYNYKLAEDIGKNYKKYVKMIEHGCKQGMKKIYQAFNYVLEKYNYV